MGLFTSLSVIIFLHSLLRTLAEDSGRWWGPFYGLKNVTGRR